MATHFTGLNSAANYSFYAIPAAWAVAMAPHFYAMMLYNKERAPGTPEWDGSVRAFSSSSASGIPADAQNPKHCIQNIKDAKMSPYMQDRVLRAERANDNGFQGLSFFASAIVAANVARLPPKTLNTLAAIYLASRIAYTYVYVNGTTKLLGNVRSGLWLTGIFTCFTMFIRAGNRFY